MNCAQLRIKISPYLDSELSFGELTTFKQHLSECADCMELITGMSHTKSALNRGIQVALSQDFVSRLQARLRAEANRPPSFWQQITAPRVRGFSPLALSGLTAAGLALLVVGASLFEENSAPLIDPPDSTTQTTTPFLITPGMTGPSSATAPLLTVSPSDSSSHLRDSSRRDFSRQMKYVNTGRRP